MRRPRPTPMATLSERAFQSRPDAVGFGLPVRLLPSFSSAPQNVDNRENNDPNAIHEMPVERKHFGAFGLLRSNAAGQSKEKYDSQQEQTDNYVRGVQPHQGVVRGSKEIRGNSQSMFIN